MPNSEFAFRRVASTGCEILDPDGVVVAWTVNETWAAVVVALLNDNPRVAAVGVGDELPDAARCCRGPMTAMTLLD